MIVKAGYEAGAKEVIVHWGDDEVARLRYEYAPVEVFENVPKWRADSMNSYAENGAAFIAITAENPNAFKGVDREKQMAAAKANDKAMEPYYKRMVSSQVQWVVEKNGQSKCFRKKAKHKPWKVCGKRSSAQ